ncbi:hypothetical protein H9L39_12087 [Fusarium oxysporum f. sp. albedinis]|nr:hypothetical protein H9L39_12087 [Fusarium oxysporum f. sp. albedinis]
MAAAGRHLRPLSRESASRNNEVLSSFGDKNNYVPTTRPFCHQIINEKSGRKLLSIFPPTSRRFSLRMVERHSLITTTVSQDEAIHSFKKTHALTIFALCLSPGVSQGMH